MIVGFGSVVAERFWVRIQTNIIESFHFEGIPGAFFRGRGPVWPGRGNTAALSPGPSSEHPAAWRRAPDCGLPMTEGAQAAA